MSRIISLLFEWPPLLFGSLCLIGRSTVLSERPVLLATCSAGGKCPGLAYCTCSAGLVHIFRVNLAVQLSEWPVLLLDCLFRHLTHCFCLAGFFAT
jgi:hypothetical protein